MRHRRGRFASVEIVGADLTQPGLRVHYEVRPVPADLGLCVAPCEGAVMVTIDGVRCPNARIAYRLLPDGSAVVGTLSVPIRIQRSVLLHIRFPPLAQSVGWDARTCEALLQVCLAEIDPISARWVRPRALTGRTSSP